jgi:hypothetical protein
MSHPEPQRDGLTRHFFDMYTSRQANDLVMILSSVQKSLPPGYRGDWMQFVTDVMTGMDMHDAGLFPEEWFPEEDE